MTEKSTGLFYRSVIAGGTALLGANGEPVYDRMTGMKWWLQDRMAKATVDIYGCGGNSWVAPQFAEMGVGRLRLFDQDAVDATNLSRQFFTEADVGRNKALALINRVEPHCISKTTLEAFASRFQTVARERPKAFDEITLGVCLIDNDKGRRDASKLALEHGFPLLIMALSEFVNSGYVFIQAQNGPCFECWKPENDQIAAEERAPIRYMCHGAPAAVFLPFAITGIAGYAGARLIMAKPPDWNFFEFFYDLPSRLLTLEKREGCKVCG